MGGNGFRKNGTCVLFVPSFSTTSEPSGLRPYFGLHDEQWEFPPPAGPEELRLESARKLEIQLRNGKNLPKWSR